MSGVNLLEENEVKEIEEGKEFIEILKTFNETEKSRVQGFIEGIQTVKINYPPEEKVNYYGKRN